MAILRRHRFAPGSAPARREELLRAARLLALRTRREASGLLAGRYASAFRGGGIVFEESRPYVPGDDVRRMDWNAMARTGVPYVKHYREERDRAVRILLDGSASMAFGSGAHTLAETAARTAALLVAAAAHAGDRVALTVAGATSDAEDAGRGPAPPVRGAARASRLIERLGAVAAAPAGETSLDRTLARLAEQATPDSLVFVISDFRPAGDAGQPWAPPVRALASLGLRSDLVCVVVDDPRAHDLPAAGPVRIRAAEGGRRTCLLDTGDPGLRARYRLLARARRRALEDALRAAGADVLWLMDDRDPLRALGRFFHDRAARTRIPPA